MSDPEDPMSAEELEFAEKLDEKISNVENKLKSIGISGEMIQKIISKEQPDPETIKQSQEKMGLKVDEMIEMPTIDRKGRWILNNKQIHENYEKSWPLLQYTQLPICWSNFKEKLIFTLPMSFMAAYAFELISMKKINKGVSDVSWRKLGRNWMVTSVIGFVWCAADSVFFDEFCNIDSYHYKDLNRGQYLKELREKLQGKS